MIQRKGAIHLEHEKETARILPNYKKRAKIKAGEENFLAKIGATLTKLVEPLAS